MFLLLAGSVSDGGANEPSLKSTRSFRGQHIPPGYSSMQRNRSADPVKRSASLNSRPMTYSYADHLWPAYNHTGITTRV